MHERIYLFIFFLLSLSISLLLGIWLWWSEWTLLLNYQKWEDEGERQRILAEKHSRGCVARSKREVRVQQKELRNTLKSKRYYLRKKMNILFIQVDLYNLINTNSCQLFTIIGLLNQNSQEISFPLAPLIWKTNFKSRESKCRIATVKNNAS